MFWKSERALYLNKEINWLCRKDPYARVLIVVCPTKVPFYYWLLRNISQEIDRSRQCMHSTLTYRANKRKSSRKLIGIITLVIIKARSVKELRISFIAITRITRRERYVGKNLNMFMSCWPL